MDANELEAFKAEAARKQIAYERERRATSHKVQEFYRNLHGEGSVTRTVK